MHSHYTFRISHIRSHKGLLKDYFTEHPLVRGEVKEGNSPFGGSLFPTTFCVNLFHLEGHQIFLTTHGNTFLETCSK